MLKSNIVGPNFCDSYFIFVVSLAKNVNNENWRFQNPYRRRSEKAE